MCVELFNIQSFPLTDFSLPLHSIDSGCWRKPVLLRSVAICREMAGRVQKATGTYRNRQCDFNSEAMLLTEVDFSFHLTVPKGAGQPGGAAVLRRRHIPQDPVTVREFEARPPPCPSHAFQKEHAHPEVARFASALVPWPKSCQMVLSNWGISSRLFQEEG